jgi:predicted N-acetyltransferase YhbS
VFRLLAERPEDLDEVEALLDTAFGPGRTALSSYRLREGVPPIAGLSRVARDEFDAVAGSIRFWPVRVGARGDAAALLGPVAVHPTRQGEGLGGLLILDGLERAAAAGWRRAILVGDEPYYRRFGFSRAAAQALDYPPPTNPARLLARALAPGAFAGVEGVVRRWTAGGPPPDAPP